MLNAALIGAIGIYPDKDGIYLCKLKHKTFGTSSSKREYKDSKWIIPDNFTLLSWSEYKEL